jgi:hypothetical protein
MMETYGQASHSETGESGENRDAEIENLHLNKD